MDAGEIDSLREELGQRTALQVLQWASRRFAPQLSLATGFGAEGCVLIDLVARHQLPIDIFTLDTGLLFPETYALWHQLEQRYGIRIRAVRPALSLVEQAARHGDALWQRDPDGCCALRKVQPLEHYLSGYTAWVTAIRRGQAPSRRASQVLEPDARFGIVKINPLVTWTHEDVLQYLDAFAVPRNQLHARGYPSIGCRPCTSAVQPGEDPRSGRWRGQGKTECGLHSIQHTPRRPGNVST